MDSSEILTSNLENTLSDATNLSRPKSDDSTNNSAIKQDDNITNITDTEEENKNPFEGLNFDQGINYFKKKNNLTREKRIFWK